MRGKRQKNIKASPLVAVKLASHFAGQSLEQLVTATRSFPVSALVDLQLALNEIYSKQFCAELVGVHRRYGHETLTFSELLATDNFPAVIAPLQHLEIDIGEAVPASCLR